MIARKSAWRRRGVLLPAGVLALGVVGLGAVSRFGGRASGASISAPSGIPIGDVTRGEFIESVALRGDVKAQRSAVLIVPSAGGGDMQIVKLMKNGTMTKKGDVVIQLDVTTLQNTLAQRRSDYKQADAQIGGTVAQSNLTIEQDRTDLLKAQYDVERAKLEASKAEIVSQIEGDEDKLKVADAEQKLKEVQQKLASDQTSAAADKASGVEKRDKAEFDVRGNEQRIAAMTLRAPLDGMVVLMPNYRAGGMFGDNAPPFKEGDRAYPGQSIAELPDLSSLMIAVRVDESDRGRLATGEAVAVRIDAVPDKQFTGHVSYISALAKPDFSGWPPIKNFDVTLTLDQEDPRLRPGMSANADVTVARTPGATLIPSEGLFLKSGRSVVYLFVPGTFGTHFEEREVTAGRRGKGQVEILKGLQPGERIALKDPTAENSK